LVITSREKLGGEADERQHREAAVLDLLGFQVGRLGSRLPARSGGGVGTFLSAPG
jgi:hypothetical protein